MTSFRHLHLDVSYLVVMILFMTGALRCSVLCLLCVCGFAHCCLGNSAENTVILETPWKMFTFPFLWDLLYHPVWKGAVDLVFFFFFLFSFFPFSWVFNQCNFVSWWRFLLEKVTWVWKVVGKQEVKKGKSLSIIIYVNKSQF